MPRYVVLSRMTERGRHGLPKRLASSSVAEEAVALRGKLIEQYLLLGEWDLLSLVELPNNTAAQMLRVAHAGRGGVEREILPSIDLTLFERLLKQTTETTGPHRWQIRFPARLIRRLLRPYTVSQHRWRYFRPFVVEGRRNLDGFRGPAIFIANHSSHYDMYAFIEALPSRFRDRIYFGSAADRWYLKGRKEIQKQGWWRSLVLGCFPIHRGGGERSLGYPEWLIGKGNSIGIFPEGTRTTTGHFSKFRPGTARLALKTGVPVVPMYFEGLRKMLPKGHQTARPGPVTVRIGRPIEFDPGMDPMHATQLMYEAMKKLRDVGAS